MSHLRPQSKPVAFRRILALCATGVLAAALFASCTTLTARGMSGGAGSKSKASGGGSAGKAVVSLNGVLRTKLKNGLRVVIVRDALAPVVTQQITYFVGSNEAPAGFPGTAHAQEHMMFRGSPGLSGQQLSEIAAQLGGSMDAYTTNSMTSYFFTVPAEDLGLTLKIGALRMTAVNDKASAWKTERGAIEQEVARDNSNPLYKLQAKARAHIFAGTPYSHTALGTTSSFNKTTAKMLKHFWKTWYAPNNALLVIAGDVKPQQVLAKVKRLYGSIPSKKLPAKPTIKLSTVNPKTFSSKTDEPYGMVAYVFRMPGYSSTSYPAAALLSGVLDSQRGPIAALSYNGKALGAGFSYQSFHDTGYAYAWAAYPPGGSAKKMAASLKAAIEKGASHISSSLVKAQKHQVLLGKAVTRNSISGLARAWTNVIAVEGLPSPNAAAARLERAKLAGVKKAAKKYIDFSHAVTLQLTPTSGARPTKGGKLFGKPESFTKTPKNAVKLPSWAASQLAKLPHPKPLFHPTTYRLKNGIKLIVQPVPHSRAVSLFGNVNENGDLQAPSGQAGVGSLLDSLYSWGPAGMSRSTFEAAMDKLGASYSVGSGFSLEVLPSYFAKSLKLLSQDLLHPALPAKALRSQQALLAREIAGQHRSPLYRFNRTIRTSLLPKGDPALRQATPSSVSHLTRKELRSYAAKVMRPDETSIVVMGNVQPKKVRALIEKDFGSWKNHGPKPKLIYPPIPLSNPVRHFVPDSFRQQDTVVLAETLDTNYTQPVHYALELGNAFLGGDLAASPLFRQLRVERGLVYSVGSSADFSRTRGSFRISYGAYPKNVSEARKLAVKALAAMGSKPLTPRELHLAKASELRQVELTNQSIGDVAGSWLGYSSEGLPLDQLYNAAHHFEKITAAQIEAAYKKYVDPSRLSTFIIGKHSGT